MSNVSFIGAGNMGGAIIRSVCQTAGAAQVCIFDPAAAAMEALAGETGCRTADSAAEAVQGADFVFFCVKPQVLPQVVRELDVYKRQTRDRHGGCATECIPPSAGMRRPADPPVH